MKRTIRIQAVLLLLTGALAQNLFGNWKAGLARTNITPESPIWLAGFGSRTKPSEGVLHPIFVKALALQDDSNAISVLVTSDLLGFNRDMAAFVAREVQDKFKLPRHRLAINSSHTHSAPVKDNVLRPAYPYDGSQQEVINRYTAKLLRQVVETIGNAIKDLSPAVLAFDQGLAGFAVNRRRVGHREYPGPVDHDARSCGLARLRENCAGSSSDTHVMRPRSLLTKSAAIGQASRKTNSSARTLEQWHCSSQARAQMLILYRGEL